VDGIRGQAVERFGRIDDRRRGARVCLVPEGIVGERHVLEGLDDAS
jgi:hypothetical protein